MDIHSISSEFAGGMGFTHNINDHTIDTDTLSNDGGNNVGPTPKRLMLASLAGCTGVDVVSMLNKMRVNFSDFTIDVAASLSDEHPKIYKKVNVIYKIKIAEADKPKMEKAVQLSEEKYCGVMAMFKAFAEVNLKIIYL